MVYTFTDEEKAQFEKDGFLIVRQEQHQLFDPKDLYRWAYEVKAWPKVKGKWMVYEEMSTAGKVEPLKTEFFSNWHDDLRQVMREGDLLNVLQQLSGGEMCIFKEKINYKAPGCHGFIAHIDAPSYDDTAKVPHLTCLIAVDPNTKENGCLEVVKGSHKMAHVPDPAEVKASKGWPVSNIDPKWIESHEWTPAVLEPGDILFFGSHIAHRSAANNSDKSRARFMQHTTASKTTVGTTTKPTMPAVGISTRPSMKGRTARTMRLGSNCMLLPEEIFPRFPKRSRSN